MKVDVEHTHMPISPERRAALGRRAQFLAAGSVTYNVIEAVIAIAAGLAAGSVALIGFGLDSVVEVSSGLIILWQYRHRLPETRERQALRLMALLFFALAAYVLFESVRALIDQSEPESSPVGIVLAAVSLAVMPLLSWAQRRTGRALNSNAVVADSTQTLLCTYLSAVLLIGLVLNATLGWYWADPIAGLVIAGIAVREGRQAWRGEGCCAPGHQLTAVSAPGCGSADDGCEDACCVAPGASSTISVIQRLPRGDVSHPRASRRSDSGSDRGAVKARRGWSGRAGQSGGIERPVKRVGTGSTGQKG